MFPPKGYMYDNRKSWRSHISLTGACSLKSLAGKKPLSLTIFLR